MGQRSAQHLTDVFNHSYQSILRAACRGASCGGYRGRRQTSQTGLQSEAPLPVRLSLSLYSLLLPHLRLEPSSPKSVRMFQSGIQASSPPEAPLLSHLSRLSILGRTHERQRGKGLCAHRAGTGTPGDEWARSSTSCSWVSSGERDCATSPPVSAAPRTVSRGAFVLR